MFLNIHTLCLHCKIKELKVGFFEITLPSVFWTTGWRKLECVWQNSMYEIVWANLGECFSLDWRKLYSFWGHFEITLGSLHLYIHNLSLGLYLLHMNFIDSFQFSILHTFYAFSSNEHLFKSFLLLSTLLR